MITAEALTKILDLAATSTRDGLETGGILLGHDRTDKTDIIVDAAGDPGPNAIRLSNRFNRDREHAQRLADSAWRRCRAQWIGDWHTHPGGDSAPSEFDLRSYAGQLNDGELRFSEFLTIVVAVAGNGAMTLGSWMVSECIIEQVSLQVVKSCTDRCAVDNWNM